MLRHTFSKINFNCIHLSFRCTRLFILTKFHQGFHQLLFCTRLVLIHASSRSKVLTHLWSFCKPRFSLFVVRVHQLVNWLWLISFINSLPFTWFFIIFRLLSYFIELSLKDFIAFIKVTIGVIWIIDLILFSVPFIQNRFAQSLTVLVANSWMSITISLYILF